jgi:hypothetical protein
MADLENLFTRLDIQPPLLQPCVSQGPQHFHPFTKLPFEIRKMIWKFTFPDARSIRVRPLVPDDRFLCLLDHSNNRVGVLDVGFSYKDNDPIVALRTVRESRQAAQSVYRCLVKNGQTIYFCPDRDTLLFAGFEKVAETLVLNAWRPASIAQLLRNTCDREASPFADTSTIIQWSGPVLARSANIKSEPSLGRQAPLHQERRDKYAPLHISIPYNLLTVA